MPSEWLPGSSGIRIASLPACRLTAAQWLLLVRLHWGVENNCHHTLDTAFEEDDRPWIESNPRGMLVVALLRRLAYNLVTLFRSVTQVWTDHVLGDDFIGLLGGLTPYAEKSESVAGKGAEYSVTIIMGYPHVADAWRAVA